eukprot:TRINITY_DN16264_c0_g1_i1.p1 TRINITY_DN16264_c0_g1~~TRINITY_DN16264_c0_g1_i1.p1  ORF type:complete len:772 (+),score=254.39 TRINITY_DN16264_c0_g1_i1:87-2318(+)
MQGQPGPGRRRFSRTTVTLQNLPSHQTTSSLYGAFRIYGDVARIARMDASSATVTYKSDRDALEMKQYEDQVQVDGLPLMVAFADSSVDEEIAAAVSANPTKDQWKCWLCGAMNPNTSKKCCGLNCDVEKGLDRKYFDAAFGFEFGNGVTPGVVAPDRRTTVIATDIPKLPNNEEAAVRTVFGRYGPVTNVWVHQSNRGTEAHVTYETEEAADMAVEYEHSRQLDPHQIVVWKATSAYVVEINPVVKPWPQGAAAVEAALTTLVAEKFQPKYGVVSAVRVRPDLAVIEFPSFTSVLQFLDGEGETEVDGQVCHSVLSRWSKWPCMNCGYPQNQAKHNRCVACSCAKLSFGVVNLAQLWPQMEMMRMHAAMQGNEERPRNARQSKRERERERDRETREREREMRERDALENGDDDDPMIIPIGGGRRERQREKQQQREPVPATRLDSASSTLSPPGPPMGGNGSPLLNTALLSTGSTALPPARDSTSRLPVPTSPPDDLSTGSLLNPSMKLGGGAAPPASRPPPLSPALSLGSGAGTGRATDNAPYIDSALLLSTLSANNKPRNASPPLPFAGAASSGSPDPFLTGGRVRDPFGGLAPASQLLNPMPSARDLESAQQGDTDFGSALDSLLEEVNFNQVDEQDTARPSMSDPFLNLSAAPSASKAKDSFDPWARPTDPWGGALGNDGGDALADPMGFLSGNLMAPEKPAPPPLQSNNGFGEVRGTDSDDEGLIAMLCDYNNALVG